VKIAQIAPLMESVPPRLYGGTERIVSYLTDELVRLGHEVTLFASADSVTAAELVSCASMALRLDRNVRDRIPYYLLMLDRVRELAEDFDILLILAGGGERLRPPTRRSRALCRAFHLDARCSASARACAGIAAFARQRGEGRACEERN
jgi:putative intracellular protease/amidase